MDVVYRNVSKLVAERSILNVDQLLDEEGFTLALRAVQGNQLEVVKVLVTQMNASVGPGTQNQYGFSALHLAAFYEVSSELVGFLLDQAPALINAQETGGWTPLIIAASKGNLKLVEQLLQRGADVNAKTHLDQTALYVSANNGFATVVNYLLDHGADARIRVKKSLESPAFAAIVGGHVAILERLVKHDSALLRLPTVSGATILHAAAQIGKEATVAMLLQAGADVHSTKKDGSSPLANAASLGHVSIVRLLLNHGASLDSRNGFGGTPLHLAANTKQLEMVELLLTHQADPNLFDSDLISPLQALCSSAATATPNNETEIKIFDLLVKHGAKLDHKDRSDAIFLHQLVCKKDHLLLLQHVLASYDIDPFVEDRYGYWPLHIVCRYKHVDVIAALETYMKSKDAAKFAQFDPDKPRKEPAPGLCETFEAISESERMSVLGMDLSLSSIASKIKSGAVKNVVVLTGAGISTNSGIPDFRSPEKGMYTSPQFKEKYGAGGLAHLFSPSAVEREPELFFSAVKEIFGPAVDGRYTPTPAHFFLKLLHDKGILLRNYTQNIDMLERLVGLPKSLVIEAHGSFAKARCVKCHSPCTNIQEYWNDIQGDLVPRCTSCNGVLRPDVVFFGESLPAEFTDCQGPDFKNCDLLIVMGTSLKVYPFAGLTNQVTNLTPRLLFNAEPVGPFAHGAQWSLPQEGAPSQALTRLQHKDEYTNSYRDVAVIGDIDKGVRELAEALGWSAELQQMIASYKPCNQFQ